MAETPEDPMPEMVAEIDQMIAMATHLARYAKGLFAAFKDAGFTDAEALYLTSRQIKSDSAE